MSDAIKQFNENKMIPMTIVDNGEGYLKLAKVKQTGEIIPLKEVLIDEVKKNVKITPYNPAEILIKISKFFDDNRLYKIEDKKFEQNKEKEWEEKRKKGETKEGKDLFFYEVILPEGGGVKFRAANSFSGYIYPVLWDGSPPEEYVLAAASFKRLIPVIVKYAKVRKLFDLLKLRFIFKMFPDLVKFVRDGLYKYLLERKAYSPQIREVYDFISLIKDEVKDKYKELAGWIRDIICFYLQFDYAYRFRFEDIVGQIRQEEFVIEKYTIWKKLGQWKNKFLLIVSLIHPSFKKKIWNKKRFKRPVAEIYRSFEVLMSRDYYEMNQKWKKLRDVICLFLEFSSYFTNLLQKAALKTDFSKMAMTEENLYWASYQNASYNYGGKDKNQLVAERIKKYGK